MHVDRVQFRVWAPNAMSVSVIGDFNDWDPQRSPLRARTDGSGIFDGALEHVPIGTRYKYRIVDARNGQQLDKADPFAFWSEVAPGTASRLVSLDFEWRDEAWMSEQAAHNALDRPLSIYEVHFGSGGVPKAACRRMRSSPSHLLAMRTTSDLRMSSCSR